MCYLCETRATADQLEETASSLLVPGATIHKERLAKLLQTAATQLSRFNNAAIVFETVASGNAHVEQLSPPHTGAGKTH